MKRTEVINKIADMMEYFDRDNGTWVDDAERLLNYLENLGMSAPLREVVTRGTGCDTYTVTSRSWEDENETK